MSADESGAYLTYRDVVQQALRHIDDGCLDGPFAAAYVCRMLGLDPDASAPGDTAT